MSVTTTDPGTSSSREIEREVDRTRADLSASVAALQDRFSVETILDDVMRSIARNGGEVSRNLGRTVRENPLPLILTGVGLAWLIAGSGREPEQHDTTGDADRPDVSGRLEIGSARPGPGPDRAPTSVTRFGGGSGGPSAGASTTDASSSAASTPSMGDRVRDAYETVTDRAGELGREGRDRLGHAGRDAVRAGAGLSARAETFIEDQPLVVAALGFAAGLGIGGLVPRSRAEDELMGARSDAIKASARQMAGEQVDKARAVAGAVAHEAVAIGDEMAGDVDERTPGVAAMVDQAKEQLGSAAEGLKDAATREVSKHDQTKPAT